MKRFVQGESRTQVMLLPVGGEFVFKRRSVIGISRGSPFANVRIIGLLTKTRFGESKRNPDASTEPTWPIQF